MSIAKDLFGNTVLVEMTCGECGVVFGMEKNFHGRKIQDLGSWYCLNGHNRRFIGETEADKLKKQLAEKEAELKWAREGRDSALKKNTALKAVATRAKNEKFKLEERVRNGVCPCCTRSFQNLRRHMKTKHGEGAK